MVHASIQVWRRHPAFPAQWLYGLYEIVLVTLLFVTPSLSGSALAAFELDACIGASDPNDFAVRKCRARQSLPCVHRSLPRVCDDGRRPFGGTGWRESYD
jgi:hypothetical protein